MADSPQQGSYPFTKGPFTKGEGHNASILHRLCPAARSPEKFFSLSSDILCRGSLWLDSSLRIYLQPKPANFKRGDVLKSDSIWLAEVVTATLKTPEQIFIEHPSHSKMNPIARLLLVGHQDVNSPLSMLPLEVLRLVFQYWQQCWWQHVTVGGQDGNTGVYASVIEDPFSFPAPTGINVNMMPIMLGALATVPENLRHYIGLIAACPIMRSDWGRIGYLTIQESVMTADGASQRRGGLHTEGGYVHGTHKGEWRPVDRASNPMTIAWGRGSFAQSGECGHYIGGLYMASTVANSCRVWNARIDPALVGHLGDIEPLRSALGPGATLRAGELVWMTDLTPHESLPLPAGTARSYFRLVTSNISVWYADHSTPNPLGIQPPPHVQILAGDKFVSKTELPSVVKKENSLTTCIPS